MKTILSVFIILCLSALAKADVVVIVHPSGPSDMTVNQVRDLFIGRANQLPDGQAAVPLEMPTGDALRQEFHDKVTGRSQAQLNAFWSQQVFTGKGNPPRTVDSSGAMKSLVASTPGAVGYIPAGEVDDSVKVLLKP